MKGGSFSSVSSPSSSSSSSSFASAARLVSDRTLPRRPRPNSNVGARRNSEPRVTGALQTIAGLAWGGSQDIAMPGTGPGPHSAGREGPGAGEVTGHKTLPVALWRLLGSRSAEGRPNGVRVTATRRPRSRPAVSHHAAIRRSSPGAVHATPVSSSSTCTRSAHPRSDATASSSRRRRWPAPSGSSPTGGMAGSPNTE